MPRRFHNEELVQQREELRGGEGHRGAALGEKVFGRGHLVDAHPKIHLGVPDLDRHHGVVGVKGVAVKELPRGHALAHPLQQGLHVYELDAIGMSSVVREAAVLEQRVMGSRYGLAMVR